MGVDDGVRAGLPALDAGRWEEARAAFEAALAEQETPEALDGLGHALAALGDYAAAIDLRQRAFAAFRARGETRYPAMIAAYWLAFEYAALYGNSAAAAGWLERGRHLAEASGDCRERGWVELACALAADRLDVREQHVQAAAAVAHRFGDTDLEFDTLAYAGVCRIERGRVQEGMRMLDEAVAAATSGELASAAVAGEIYCKMLLACEMTLDVRRAEQWTAVADSFVARSKVVWASAICRMYYGGILIAAGRWAEAEQELTTSIRLYDASYRALRSGSLARLADLRVRQGDLEATVRLLAGFEHDSYRVRPLARLHMARGDADQAGAVLRRHLNEQQASVLDIPILALLTEAELAAGRRDHACQTSARLAAAAGPTGAPALRAFAALAAAAVAETTTGAAGEAAAVELESALAGFIAAGLPLEEARTRLELAGVLARSTPAVAAAGAQTALAIFERLGAWAQADAAGAVLRTLGGRRRAGPRSAGALSRREQEVLRLVGLGLSNPEIAERLFISRKTAAHHVSNVLTKLGLRNRAQAAVHAAQVMESDT